MENVLDSSVAIAVGACAGAVGMVVFFSLSVAAVYRDRGLVAHAAASCAALLAILQLPGQHALEVRAVVLLILSGATWQMHELLRHLPALAGPRRLLRALGIGLLAAALPVHWLDRAWMLPCLAAWAGVMAFALCRCWRYCRPWGRTAGAGMALLAVAGLVEGTWAGSSARGSLYAAACMAGWSCLLYMATVWRHRMLSDVQLTRVRDRFLAILGHDLRAPLQTISMATQILDRGADAPSIAHRIRRSSARMERLISDVLDLSRLQNGGSLGVRIAQADLAEVAREALNDAQLAHPETAFELAAPAQAPVRGDADRLHQLLDNLLANARLHGEVGSPIRLSVRGDGQRVFAEVRNRAQPIPRHIQAQLFSPYKDDSAANPKNRGGLGLGLYISHEIAVGHGGSLAYRWEDGDVVFIFAVPAA